MPTETTRPAPMSATESAPTVRVSPDYGKDDEGLAPGEYAFAHGFLAGPAPTREAAMKALAGNLWDEGNVVPGDDVEASFFTWPPEQFAATRAALVHALDAYLDAREAQARAKTLPRGHRAWGEGPGS